MTDAKIYTLRPAVPHDTCENCGGVWWNAAVVFEDGYPTGWGDVSCRECGHLQ